MDPFSDPEPSVDELERLGLYDPSAPDAADRLALIRDALTLGASLEEIATKSNLGELVLDLTLRPRQPVTLDDIARDSGLDRTHICRLLNGIGLPADPDDELTADEQVAVRVLASAAADLLGFESTMQLARATGAAMARVAEALVTAVRLRVEAPGRALGVPNREMVTQYSGLAQTMLPDFVRALDATLRRQIVAVADRMWALDTEHAAVVLPRTIGFADLVGYTATAAKLSARELTEVLMEFDELVWEIVLANGGQILKMIGDEAMFVTEDPVLACRISERLVLSFGHGNLPPLRVGLAVGDVVSVFGDIYGSDVNLAARLVEAAEPSTVLVSEEIRARCASEFVFEPLGPLNLRGIKDAVEVARIRPTSQNVNPSLQ